ncbi:MAG: alpha-E domain-containing protein [Candidatus Rokubacteria bacterium]|nr:alpha-E domain-containing protein [Candidatus Rokubacteria bacterium]
MILSRVADALYWMGRYLERAENVARLLLVTEDLATEVLGLDEDLARSEWLDLQRILPGPEPPEAVGRHAGQLAAWYLHALSIDARHPASVYHSLRQARENARTVREALTVEVFVNLNETYQDLEGHARRRIIDPPAFRGAITETHRGILATVGAIEHTLTRDPSWLFLKLGESLERVFRTATILRAKVPSLLTPEPKADLPLVYTRWRALLRSLSSLENFRQMYGARLEPLDVIQFLLLDPRSPRSVRYGIATVKDYAERISGRDGPSPALRIMGKLDAELAYQGEDMLRDGDCRPVLDRVLVEIGRTHESLSGVYFGT